MAENNEQTQNTDEPKFGILRIYLKDVSFETPNSPQIFAQNFQPAVDFQMNTAVSELDQDIYEVVLTITVTAKDADKTGFLVEIQQAGLFHLSGHDEERHGKMLGSYCPSTLFPYARATISDLVTKGGFPALDLAPVNFRALYDESLKKVQAADETKDAPAIPLN